MRGHVFPWQTSKAEAIVLRAFSEGSRVWAKHSRTLPKSLLEETMFWLTPLFQLVSWHRETNCWLRVCLLFGGWMKEAGEWATQVREWRRTFQATQITRYIKEDVLLLKLSSAPTGFVFSNHLTCTAQFWRHKSKGFCSLWYISSVFLRPP